MCNLIEIRRFFGRPVRRNIWSHPSILAKITEKKNCSKFCQILYLDLSAHALIVKDKTVNLAGKGSRVARENMNYYPSSVFHNIFLLVETRGKKTNFKSNEIGLNLADLVTTAAL